MKEPEFDASSLETPDVEPVDAQQDADLPPPEPTHEPVEEESDVGSTLERHERDEFVIKQGTITRRPKYAVFATIGGLIALLIALVLAQTGTIPAEQNYTRTDLRIVLLGLGIPAGILIGLVVALLLDRRSK